MTTVKVIEEDDLLPSHVNYWLTASSKYDVFFEVGPDGATERIGALKIFLTGHSEPLRAMLEDSQLAETGDIRIVDTDSDTFISFLKCLYGGGDSFITKISFEESNRLLCLAEKYLAEEVKTTIGNHMVGFVSCSVLCLVQALSNPACYQNSSLVDAMTKATQTKTEEILDHELFVKLNSEAMSFILKQDDLSVLESDLWQAVVKWAKHAANGSNEGQVLRDIISKQIKHIRFCSLSIEEFCNNVVPLDILSPEEVCLVIKSINAKCPDKMLQLCTDLPRKHIKLTPSMKVSSICLTISIDQISENYLKSEPVSFLNWSWSVEAIKRNGFIGVYLNCKRLKYDNAWPNVSWDVVLINFKQNTNFFRKLQKEFNSNICSWGTPKFYNWDKLVDPANGFLTNNTVTILVTFQVL